MTSLLIAWQSVAGKREEEGGGKIYSGEIIANRLADCCISHRCMSVCAVCRWCRHAVSADSVVWKHIKTFGYHPHIPESHEGEVSCRARRTCICRGSCVGEKMWSQKIVSFRRVRDGKERERCDARVGRRTASCLSVVRHTWIVCSGMWCLLILLPAGWLYFDPAPFSFRLLILFSLHDALTIIYTGLGMRLRSAPDPNNSHCC